MPDEAALVAVYSMTGVDAEALRAEGWEPVQSEGFVDFTGPYLVRRGEGPPAMGLVLQKQHANSHMGTIHGGVVMTFADNAMGMGVVDAIGGENCSTVSLQTRFVASAKVGEFLTCEPEVVRKTRNLVFVRGLVKSDDRVVATVDGIFKITASDRSTRL